MQILFLIPYPLGVAPSQRFRFEQYFETLEKNGISYDCQSFIDEKTWKVLYINGYISQKIIGVLSGFLRRLKVLFFLQKYDFIFIHREAAPIFPPIFEFLIARVFKKKIIFDFDDAIWLPNTSEQNSISAFLKFHQKTSYTCRWAWKVSAGNAYLCEYARNYNPNVCLNPTTIDTNLHKIAHTTASNKVRERLAVGWTGSHSTLKYLYFLVPILQAIEREYPIDFLVISNQKPDFQIDSLKFIKWDKKTEIQDLSAIQIGVMPLTDDEWAKGKCGFKALQYMSLGIPALVSPVGVNTEIVKSEENGFLCSTEEEWKSTLIRLIADSDLRKKIGENAKQTIENKYSVRANEQNFLSLFAS
ncbi:MAG: glycosyltransferase family 1 protein [Cytophagales bacterium]|nr:MAG: glycosyltransferase family 1 protein [Cytophagales bacterium]